MSDDPLDDDRFFAHLSTLLSVSAGMVGVCVTAIGIVGILQSVSRLELLVDDFLVVGSVLFAVVAALSFLGLRTPLRKRWRRFAVTLDVLFCMALATLVAASILLAWVILD